ncbi:hypothetical protein GX48_00433 [Paracoccidioides brasiliensis]|nr:hypothetical protein GX48_00433 [Paracoccidioides brasiliensis]
MFAAGCQLPLLESSPLEFPEVLDSSSTGLGAEARLGNLVSARRSTGSDWLLLPQGPSGFWGGETVLRMGIASPPVKRSRLLAFEIMGSYWPRILPRKFRVNVSPPETANFPKRSRGTSEKNGHKQLRVDYSNKAESEDANRLEPLAGSSAL